MHPPAAGCVRLPAVRISAKADYAIRAAVELALADGPLKAEVVAQRRDIPQKFLEKILQQLSRAGLVVSQRGPDGGHRLARAADEITVADVIRAADGPLAQVHGLAPENAAYASDLAALTRLWVALRANVRAVLEGVTLADLADGHLPGEIEALTTEPGAWVRR